MGVPELSINNLKNYFFEFTAKNGDGWSHYIGSFYGDWLVQKLAIPRTRRESNPGGGLREIDKQVLEKILKKSW